ncbi:MAG: hypothetical protein ACLUPV_12585 [Bilophila wadsworthia]
MREEPCKTYGHLFPADQHIADAVGAALSDWNIPECTELEGDIFRISFEGVFFPLDDVLDALRPLLCAESSGKIDLIDMEAWTLTRAAFSGTEITVKPWGSTTCWPIPATDVPLFISGVCLYLCRRADSPLAASSRRGTDRLPKHGRSAFTKHVFINPASLTRGITPG